MISSTNTITATVPVGMYPSAYGHFIQPSFSCGGAIDHLKLAVISLHLKNQQGYIAKLNAASSSLAKGKKNAAINQLNAFNNLVNAQRGKTPPLTPAQADDLIAEAQMIINCI